MESQQDQPTHISRTEIAKRLGRTTTSVVAAIERLGIEPVFTAGNFAYFNESVIPVIEKGMRAKNYTQRFASKS